MTELEHAIKHIKTRADAWAVKEVTEALQSISERLDKALSQEPCRVKNELKVELNELEPCGDAVSRQAVLDIVNNPLNIRLDEIIKKLPSVNTQPCDDAISRKWLLDGKRTVYITDRFDGRTSAYISKKTVEDAPSVTQKSGEWIETEYHRWRCSVCREKGMSEWDNIHDVRTNFCPDCGAKMFEPQESEDKE